MKKVDEIKKPKKTSSLPYVWCTYVREKNRTSLETSITTLQMKPKQNFISKFCGQRKNEDFPLEQQNQ
jgi:hypothetical protein